MSTKPVAMAISAARGGEDQPDPLGAVQVERLVAAFSEESHDQTAPFSSCGWTVRIPDQRSGGPPSRRWCGRDRRRTRPGDRRRGASPALPPRRPGRTPSPSRKTATSGSVDPGRATTARSPGERSYSGGMSGRSALSMPGIGKAVRAGGGPVEGGEEPVLDLLGQLVLEGRRQPVGLRPAVAEHVGQETLDDAVAADDAHGPPATGFGQLDPVVGGVDGQAPVGQLLDGGGHGAGRDAERGGQVAGPGPGSGLRARRQAPDGLQRLALGFRQGRIHNFAGRAR